MVFICICLMKYLTNGESKAEMWYFKMAIYHLAAIIDTFVQRRSWILLVVICYCEPTFADYRLIDRWLPRLIDCYYRLFRTSYGRLQLTRNYFRAFVKAGLVGHYVSPPPPLQYVFDYDRAIWPVTMAKLKYKAFAKCARRGKSISQLTCLGRRSY